MANFWKRIEPFLEQYPVYLEASDRCYYAREYIKYQGFSASDTNQLITNFKHGVSHKGKSPWQYKINATIQFANELSRTLPPNSTIAHIPCSKCRADEDYDPRFDMVFEHLSKRRRDIITLYPLSISETHIASHNQGTRNVNTLYTYLVWEGLPEEIETLILIDDVITSGAHFKACQRLIMEHRPDINLIGLFWARAIEKNLTAP